MKPATSSRPCIDSAASWSAAIQPSVRSSRATTSAGGELQAHRPVEVRRHLLGREPQLRRTDLDQLATGSQPGQRHRRVGPAGDHQVEARWQVVEQERHGLLHLAGLDEVVVVEHQHDLAAGRADVVEQRGEQHLDRWRLRCGQQCQLVHTHVGLRSPQGRDQVGPEGHRIVVTPVERQPGHAPPLRRSRQPLCEQAWSCRSRRARRRASASRRRRHPDARSVSDAGPGRLEAWADRASSREEELA